MAFTDQERQFLIKLRDDGVSKENAITRLQNVRLALTALEPKVAPKEAEKPGFGERLGEQFKKGAKELVAPTVGAVKRIAETGLAASELIQRGLEIPAELITGKEIITPELSKAEALQREGVGEKLGAFTVDVAAFALPLGGAAGLAKTAPLATRALTQAGVAGAVIAAQTGKIGKEVAISAGIAGAFPVAGATFKKIIGTLFGRSKLIQSATGLTRTVSSKADDIAQSNIKVKGQLKKAYEGIDDFLVDEGFFIRGTQTTRADILQHADDLFKATTGSKKSVLQGIKTTIPIKRVPQFKILTNKLIDSYKGLGLSDDFARIKEIQGKTRLTAVDLDDLRRFTDALLPRGAFSGAEPVKTKGLERAIAPLRSLIASLDDSGIIQQDNVRKRVLAQLLGIGKQTNPLKLAVEKDPGFNILRDLGIGATGAFTVSAIPGGQAVAPFVAGAGIAKAITENPQIASGLINVLTKFQGQIISPDLISNIIKSITLATVNQK